MPKKILILDGHPAPDSLSGALAEIYGTSAKAAGHETKSCRLHDMQFDIDFGVNRTRDGKPLEPMLQGFMEDMKWADRFVLAFPMWWGNMPGKLKGLFDRALLPGLAYDPRNPNRMGVPAPLLAGRSARVFITADTPAFVQRWIFGNALQRHLSAQVLGFCGIKPVRMSYFGGIKDAAEATVQSHLKTAENQGKAAQ